MSEPIFFRPPSLMENLARQAEIPYRPDIDGLRGVAVLAVVAYHIGLPWVRGGFTGVDIFFVISGFLITQLLLKEAQSRGTISIGNFYARRVRRLLPALATVLTTVLLLGAIFLPNFGEKAELSRAARATVFFVANQYFLTSTGGYFDAPSTLFPLLHLWSLSVEEQFYVVWPLLLIVAVKLSPPAKRITSIRSLIAVLLAGSFVASTWLLRTHPAAAFFILPSRAWELSVGALLATVPAEGRMIRPVWTQGAAMLGMVLIAIGILYFSDATPFPGPSATVPVVGSALLIFAGLGASRNIVSRVLSVKPMVTIGLLSYSWYLWHWPLLSIVRNRRFTRSDLPMDCLIALIALGFSALTVRFIEEPIRHHKGMAVAQRKVLLGGAATLVVLLIFTRALGVWIDHGPKSPYNAIQVSERPPTWNTCGITKASWDGRIFRPNCDWAPAGVTAGASPLVVAWGDSHADSWSPGLRNLAIADGIELRLVTIASCPPLLGLDLTDCSAYNAEAIKGITRIREADMRRKIGVVLSARWPAHLGTFPIPVRDLPPAFPLHYSNRKGSVNDNLEALRFGLRETLSALQKLNMRVLILLDGPEFHISPVRCADLYGEPACGEHLQGIVAYRKPAVDAVRQVAGEYSEVRVFDPLPLFCTGDWCPAFMIGHPVDWDDSHISPSMAKIFAPSIREDFRWLVGNN